MWGNGSPSGKSGPGIVRLQCVPAVVDSLIGNACGNNVNNFRGYNLSFKSCLFGARLLKILTHLFVFTYPRQNDLDVCSRYIIIRMDECRRFVYLLAAGGSGCCCLSAPLSKTNHAFGTRMTQGVLYIITDVE